MVRFVYWLLFAISFAAQSARCQESDPIIATVGSGGALVHGGPDDVHYATSRLEPGTELEIYRLDPGHWCAIRPPADSFSLVSGSAVRWIDQAQGIGEIVAEDERCWVGTTLGEVDEPMWQVTLNRGERVRVLGSIPSVDDPSRVEWYQVAPPNGEFRWIRWSDLDEPSRVAILDNFDTDTPSLVASATKTILQRDEPVAPISVLELSEAEASDSSGDIALTGFSQDEIKTQPAKTAPTQGQWRTPQKRRASPNSNLQVAQAQYASSPFIVPDSNRDVRSLPQSSSGATGTGPSYWPPALQQLDLRLSTEILKEPAQWQLDSIAAEAMRIKQGGLPSEAAIADHLLNKIHQFRLLKDGGPSSRGPDSTGPVQGVVAVVGHEAIPLLNVSPTGANETGEYGSGFDAYGWLNELVRNEGMGQTTYVLQDDQGKITHLVSATPGLNLHRYLKTKIGIVGQKGFHQQMKLDHVTAERIVSFDSLRR